MKITSKLIFLITTMLSCSVFGSEYSSSHRAAAERLIEIEGGSESHEATVNQALQIQIEMNPGIAKFQDVIMRWQQEYVGWNKLKPIMVDIICKSYSEEEIQDLETFYNTETGAKMLEKGETIILETMEASQRLAMEHQIQLNLMIRERVKELELEVKNLFPEWAEDVEEMDPLKKEYSIARSNSFSGTSMEEFAYPIEGRVIQALPNFDPYEDVIPVSISKALKLAYENYYTKLGISEEDFRTKASVSIETYSWKPESTLLDQKVIRFYQIDIGMIFTSTVTDPPAVIVLSDGTILRPQKKVQ